MDYVVKMEFVNYLDSNTKEQRFQEKVYLRNNIKKKLKDVILKRDVGGQKDVQDIKQNVSQKDVENVFVFVLDMEADIGVVQDEKYAN